MENPEQIQITRAETLRGTIYYGSNESKRRRKEKKRFKKQLIKKLKRENGGRLLPEDMPKL